VSDGRRRWARITTASSVVLLLVAVVSLLQLEDDYLDNYDPEKSSVVRLGPGEQKTFEISTEMLTALRIESDSGDAPEENLRLFDDESVEIPGRSPRAIDSARYGSDETIYMPVRVFEGVSGQFTIYNDAEASVLWLVDDEKSASVMFQSVWTYLFLIGCCIGSPIGIVGLVLAIMVWSDKRKKPDQFVVIDDGSVIVTQAGEYVRVESEDSGVPGPFSNKETQSDGMGGPDEVDNVEPEAWKGWDDG